MLKSRTGLELCETYMMMWISTELGKLSEGVVVLCWTCFAFDVVRRHWIRLRPSSDGDTDDFPAWGGHPYLSSLHFPCGCSSDRLGR
jgi:hypothetical protein